MQNPGKIKVLINWGVRKNLGGRENEKNKLWSRKGQPDSSGEGGEGYRPKTTLKKNRKGRPRNTTRREE